MGNAAVNDKGQRRVTRTSVLGNAARGGHKPTEERRNKMKFVMIDKGYKYATEDGSITLVKDWYKVRTIETVHHCMDKYEERTRWSIYGLEENVIYSRHTLNEAKRFVEETLTRELGELQREYSLFDESTTNKRRGERIRELRRMLGCECKARECRRSPRVVNR